MTDVVLKQSILKHLIDSFGHVQTERFVTLINNESFDYTEWRKDLYEGMTVKELSNKAMENRKRKRSAVQHV